MTRNWCLLPVAFAAAIAGCPKRETPGLWTLTTASPSLDLRRARWLPDDAVRGVRRAGEARLELELGPGFHGRVRVAVPGACPLEAEFESGEKRTGEVVPRLRVPEWIADVGYGQEVEVAAVNGCPETPAPPLAWRVLDGDAPLEMQDRGLYVKTRTPPLAQSLGEERARLPAWSIVGISPRTQGAVRLEASYADGASQVKQRVQIVAAARTTGIPTIAAGGALYLLGEGWTADPRTKERAPQMTAAFGFTRVEAKEPGRFVLADGNGRLLAVRAGRYDDMPLDCGRADCHREIGRTIQDSPMTHVFERGLKGALGDSYDPRCALACHAVGEPGLDDGGFVHLAKTLSARVPGMPDTAWFADMPRELRRTSGVGCFACHGPATIPDPAARWHALRSSVCAVCHDAPPKYGHVMFWQASRMAVSDRAPETRTGECASCHTTAGFLRAIGARGSELIVPPEAGSMGIACAACHSPHASNAAASLVRRVSVSTSLGAGDVGSSAVCLPCHGARESETPGDLPRATAARLVFAPGPHATGRGCLACHGVPHDKSAEVHGVGHSFKANPASCKPCHAEGNPRERVDGNGRTVSERATRFWEELVRRGVVAIRADGRGAPLHAQTRYAVTKGAPQELAEAARRVATVLEDPAAGIHNAARARSLLDEAGALLYKAP